MMIAISATGLTMDDQVDPRLGRAHCFLIVNTDTMEYRALENENINAGGGAGIQTAQMLSEQGVKAVLTGNCGPNAFQVFEAAGIDVIVGVSGVIRTAVEQYKSGTLASAATPNAAPHSGMQGGMGRGRGGGMGRGRK